MENDLVPASYVLSELEKQLIEFQEICSYLTEAIEWMRESENLKVTVKDFRAYLINKIANSEVLSHGQKIENICLLMDSPRVEEIFNFDFKPGNKIMIVSNKSGHGLNNGTMLTFECNDTRDYADYLRVSETRSRIHKCDVVKVDITYKDFSSKLHSLEKEIVELKEVISWMKENGFQECSSFATEVGTLLKTLQSIPNKEARTKFITDKLLKDKSDRQVQF